MAPKPSKTTAARWLASNLTDVPVAMKCQINNQKSQIFLNTNLDRLGKTAGYLQLPSFTSFALHDLYSCSCAKVLILTQLPFAVEMWVKWAKKETQLGRTLVPCCQYNFISGILASGKTKMAPKPSKTTAARWLASNLTDVPVAMKCQINNQKSQIFLNTNLDCLGKTAGYLQLPSFTFFALHDLYSAPL